MWRNKMIEWGFKYAGSTDKEMTNFFETRVEMLKPKKNKKKSSISSKKKENE